MKATTLLSVLLSAGFMFTASAGQLDAPPPAINDAPDNIQNPNAKARTVEERVTGMNQRANKHEEKEVAKENMDKARSDLDKAKVRTSDTSMWPKTKIEETVNNHNQVTEVKVTPMSTQIPYVMTREVPSNKTPSGNKDGDMTVPKFINFGF
ncbi:hypothetical protein [uncultured Parasutterella sp.]|uniref:hypothetical protein n=1 Tax=uncultured Parasutterella sp. TaxID=1263098 RepID=UPI0025B456D5|nr:hypothetical protein [uncultured Parasutterella sp.]